MKETTAMMSSKSLFEHLGSKHFYCARKCRKAECERQGTMYLYEFIKIDLSGQIIATSAEVTPNGGLVRASPPKSPSFRFRNYTNLARFM